MPGSGAGPPAGSPGPAGAQGWRHRSGAPGQCGPDSPGAGPTGAGLPGDQVRRWRPEFAAIGAAAVPDPRLEVAGRGQYWGVGRSSWLEQGVRNNQGWCSGVGTATARFPKSLEASESSA